MKSCVNDQGTLIKPECLNDCRKTKLTVRQMPKAGLVPMQCSGQISPRLYLPYRMTDPSCGQNEVNWKSKAYLAHV